MPNAPLDRLTLRLEANSMDELFDLIERITRGMEYPDRIAAIRLDEQACCAELDVASRPVDPCRLH